MSLVQITKESRIVLKVGAALAAVIFIIFLLFKGGIFVRDTFFPAPPPPPDEKFGKLPPITFPQQSGETLPEFRINTVSGVLPSFPSSFRVYKLKENTGGITSLQTAKTRMVSLGYDQNPQALSPSLYRWTKSSQGSLLTYDIISLNFTLNSNYLNSNPQLGSSDKEAISRTVTGFIDSLGSDKSDLDTKNAPYLYYTVSNGQLSEVSPESASVVKIYLPQNPVDKYNIYYPTNKPSLLYFVIVSPKDPVVAEASYNHFAPDLNTFSYYPLKSANAAYDDLKNGKGAIINSTTDSIVDITDVALGYYLGNESSKKYLMPIIIFMGRNNFKAYVSAVSD